MNKWFCEIILESDNIQLIPLRREHREDLLRAAKDGNLSELWFTSVPTIATIEEYIDKALSDYEDDKGLAFVVMDKNADKIIGMTRFTNGDPEHRRLEIGYTWYAKSFQRTYVNSECKLLLMTHAFETMKAIAVEFRTNWHNFPSRKAIERLGAKKDGVLRNHKIMPEGIYRDTVVYSIIESEWAATKHSLLYRIHSYNKKS